MRHSRLAGGSRVVGGLTLLFVLAQGFATRAVAQEVPAGGTPTLATRPPFQAPPEVSPGGAFVRALLVPGWGHTSIGEYTRGGFYFLTESATAWMLVRTRSRLGAARSVRDLRQGEARARLTANGLTDPAALQSAIAADPLVQGAEALVDARRQQFEDWLALGVFLVFLSGADAFVSAHLKDFPEPLRAEWRPGGVELGVTLPLPELRARRGARPRRRAHHSSRRGASPWASTA